MDSLTHFFQHSTIHGLGNISASRSIFGKLFWTFIVFSTLLLALLLINSSIEDWQTNPVLTIVETFPISQLKYPRYCDVWRVLKVIYEFWISKGYCLPTCWNLDQPKCCLVTSSQYHNKDFSKKENVLCF